MAGARRGPGREGPGGKEGGGPSADLLPHLPSPTLSPPRRPSYGGVGTCPCKEERAPLTPAAGREGSDPAEQPHCSFPPLPALWGRFLGLVSAEGWGYCTVCLRETAREGRGPRSAPHPSSLPPASDSRAAFPAHKLGRRSHTWGVQLARESVRVCRVGGGGA